MFISFFYFNLLEKFVRPSISNRCSTNYRIKDLNSGKFFSHLSLFNWRKCVLGFLQIRFKRLRMFLQKICNKSFIVTIKTKIKWRKTRFRGNQTPMIWNDEQSQSFTWLTEDKSTVRSDHHSMNIDRKRIDLAMFKQVLSSKRIEMERWQQYQSVLQWINWLKLIFSSFKHIWYLEFEKNNSQNHSSFESIRRRYLFEFCMQMKNVSFLESSDYRTLGVKKTSWHFETSFLFSLPCR